MKAKEAMQALIEVRLAVRKAKADDDAKTEELGTAEKDIHTVIEEDGPECRANELLKKVYALRKECAATSETRDASERLYEVRAAAFCAALKKEKLADIPPDESKRFYCDGWIAVVVFPSYNKTLKIYEMYEVEVL